MQVTSWLNKADWRYLLNPEQFRQLGAVLDAAYDYFDERLPKHRREIFAHELANAGIGPDEAKWACRLHRTTPPPKGHRLHPPLPAEIIALVNPQLTIEEQAEEIASRIWAGLSDFGSPHYQQAYAFIGPVGYEVVKQLGGWQELCATVKTDDANSWLAQLRDKARAVLTKARNAEYKALLIEAQQKAAQLRAPQAESPERAKLFGMADIIKSLPYNLRQTNKEQDEGRP